MSIVKIKMSIKNIPVAQETSTTSLRPFLVFDALVVVVKKRGEAVVLVLVPMLSLTHCRMLPAKNYQ
jgi:hypothetical protein